MPNKQNRQFDNRREPVFTVQDEIKRNRRLRRNARLRKARAKTYKLFTALLCITVFLITAAAILFTVTRVDNVTVIGNARYSAEDILEAADVNGAIMPFLSDETVKKRVVAVCPYVNSIELNKKYPDTLEIVVTEAIAVYTAYVHDRQYSLDADLRVIDFTKSKDGLIELVLPEVELVVEGSRLRFYDDANNERIPDLLNEFFGGENALPLTSLDLKNRFSITAMIGEDTKINFGDYNDIKLKLNTAHQILAKAREKNSARTLINVSSFSGAGPSAVYDYKGEF